MPVTRLQCSFGGDTAFDRDRVVITPHFNDEDLTTSAQDLCDDMAAGLNTWAGAVSPREIRVVAYDAEGTQPVFPMAETILNPGQFPASICPREIACCLSFYSERPLPRQRGRVYIPWFVAGGTPQVRPNFSQQTKVGELATLFKDLGGTEVDWCVWSRVDQVARPVTHWWVDDEWDTVRSRGLQPTTRVSGTTSEA